MARAPIRCPQCGAKVPDIEGGVHAYVPSAPGCWATFTALQAYESARFGVYASHGLVVDAYMAQHPGDGSDRRDRQSVFVHLVGLCAVIERGWPGSRPVLSRLTARRTEYPQLIRSGGPGELTVNDLVDAGAAAEYGRRALAWGTVVWHSWHEAQPQIRAALDDLERRPDSPGLDSSAVFRRHL